MERLSQREAFIILKPWMDSGILVQLEEHPNKYEGKIVDLLEDGTLEFSTVISGEGKKTKSYKLAGADFEHLTDLPEWDEVMVIFRRAAESITLRKGKKEPL
jgi:hypothetical protein